MAQQVKNPPAMQETQRCGRNPWVQKIARKRKWQPTPVCLPEKSHGQRSLAGYRPKGHKEWDTTKHVSLIWPCLLVANIDSLTMLVLDTSLIVAEGSHRVAKPKSRDFYG